MGVILALARRIGSRTRAEAGRPWQIDLGTELAGKTLGLLGLGKLGRRSRASARRSE